MAYTINFTDPFKPPFNIANEEINGPAYPLDGTTSGETSFAIYGKGVPDYGERIQENMIHHLENFSGHTAPVNPIQGQLWFSRHEHIRTGTGANDWWKWNGSSWDPTLNYNYAAT